MLNVKIKGEWKDEEFYVHVGDLLELAIDLRPLIIQQRFESLNCIVKSESAHDVYPDCPAPLGFPLFRDDLIVFKNDKVGRETYEEWRKNGHITSILAATNKMPGLISSMCVREVIDPNEQPVIVWGENV